MEYKKQCYWCGAKTFKKKVYQKQIAIKLLPLACNKMLQNAYLEKSNFVKDGR